MANGQKMWVLAIYCYYCIHLFIIIDIIIIIIIMNANSRSCSLYICCRPSVCLSSVTFVRPTQPVEIFANISTPFGTLANC